MGGGPALVSARSVGGRGHTRSQRRSGEQGEDPDRRFCVSRGERGSHIPRTLPSDALRGAQGRAPPVSAVIHPGATRSGRTVHLSAWTCVRSNESRSACADRRPGHQLPRGRPVVPSLRARESRWGGGPTGAVASSSRARTTKTRGGRRPVDPSPSRAHARLRRSVAPAWRLVASTQVGCASTSFTPWPSTSFTGSTTTSTGRPPGVGVPPPGGVLLTGEVLVVAVRATLGGPRPGNPGGRPGAIPTVGPPPWGRDLSPPPTNFKTRTARVLL